jgi:hypothetical protein
MSRARVVDGLGWVDPIAGSFALPRTSLDPSGPAPRDAIPLEMVELDGEPIVLVRGPTLDDSVRRSIRARLAAVGGHVCFLCGACNPGLVIHVAGYGLVRQAGRALFQGIDDARKFLEVVNGLLEACCIHG